ncbi:MAG: hypothetical protein FWF56_04205 [Firmicutes bacterium]|nr:hypothetical protein [Bacillota bacterium]MCL1953758.1 hypothetical protein [Bacillota bacterium]
MKNNNRPYYQPNDRYVPMPQENNGGRRIRPLQLDSMQGYSQNNLEYKNESGANTKIAHTLFELLVLIAAILVAATTIITVALPLVSLNAEGISSSDYTLIGGINSFFSNFDFGFFFYSADGAAILMFGLAVVCLLIATIMVFVRVITLFTYVPKENSNKAPTFSTTIIVSMIVYALLVLGFYLCINSYLTQILTEDEGIEFGLGTGIIVYISLSIVAIVLAVLGIVVKHLQRKAFDIDLDSSSNLNERVDNSRTFSGRFYRTQLGLNPRMSENNYNPQYPEYAPRNERNVPQGYIQRSERYIPQGYAPRDERNIPQSNSPRYYSSSNANRYNRQSYVPNGVERLATRNRNNGYGVEQDSVQSQNYVSRDNERYH